MNLATETFPVTLVTPPSSQSEGWMGGGGHSVLGETSVVWLQDPTRSYECVFKCVREEFSCTGSYEGVGERDAGCALELSAALTCTPESRGRVCTQLQHTHEARGGHSPSK